ncbi:hypothetical protein [Calothrix rhizosoleniae]|uniref:hypothetical protein n=1 Tax=Calothrix rhizosoleniae TaxID=888997 RepID=UPI000B4A0938|nr:hypothetical protein [Calothrix rhizosoleniae]
MSASDSSLESTVQRLKEVRIQLLRLHKALLEYERTTYEQLHGRIPSNGEFLRLVLGHEWFSWLRPMSQFIAQVDEELSAKEPITLNAANELLQTAHSLLQPAEEGNTSEMRYHQAIQRDVDIAFMHVRISQLFQ